MRPTAPTPERLESYRHYLTVLARMQIGAKHRRKLDPSEIVNVTLFAAHQKRDQFRGGNDAELAAWLRQILAARVANLVRHYFGTRGRDVRLEEELAAQIDNSSRMLGHELAASLSSPSEQAVDREQAVLLADALAKLPAEYREAIVLRHLEGLTFPEVATRMGKTQDSVEKLWLRGLARLKQLFGRPS